MNSRYLRAAMTVALVAAATPSQAQNTPKLELGPLLNSNGGFEDGKGMYYFTKPTLASIDNDEVFRGQAALRMKGEGTGEKSEANICVQGFKIPAPEPGARYLMRVAVRAKDVDPKWAPSVQFRREDAAKRVTTMEAAKGAITAECDWRTIEFISEPLPPDTTTLAFWLHLPSQSKATLWFDEIEVRKILNAGVVAGAPSTPAPEAKPPASGTGERAGYGPLLNSNGGFEKGRAAYYFTRPTLATVEGEGAFAGTSCLRLDGPDDAGDNNICVQGFDIPNPTASTRYSLRVAVKAKNVDPLHPPAVQFFGSEGKGKPRIVFPESKALVIGGDTDWKVLEAEASNLPAGLTSLAFWLMQPPQSKATVWFDEVEVRQVLKPPAAAAPAAKVQAVAAINPPVGVAASGWLIDINHPQLGMYEKGDEAYVVLKWGGEGEAPGLPEFGLFDERGNETAELKLTRVADGARIELPTGKLGYFEVRPLGDKAEALIPALGSRPAGRLTFAVVDKIRADRTRSFSTAFLSSQGTNILPGAANGFGWPMLPYMGIQMQGAGYQWSRWEENGPGTFEKNIQEDHQPEWVKNGKLVPYFHLNGIPMWAADSSRLPEKERSGKATQRVPPKDWAAWEGYLKKVVPYIVKNYDFLPQRTYEVMWEPVIPWGWYGTPEEIVKNFEIAYRVIHQLDPKARVAGPTLSGLNDTAVYETLLKAGLGKYLDVVSFHPYKGYPPEKNAIPEALQNIRDVTKKYAGKELPFIGTEFGFPQGTTGSALNQGFGLTTSILIFKGEGARQHTLFYMSDYAGEPGYGMNYNLVPGLPFGTGKISPKPGVPMIRAAIDEIGDAEPVGKLDYFGSDIWGYVFKENSDGTLLAALWDASDKDRTIEFDAGVPNVELVDYFGNKSSAVTKDGRLSLALKRAPVYVRGISAALYGPGKIAPLIKTGEKWTVYRGRKATFDLGFSRALGGGNATLTFDTAADVSREQVKQAVSVKPGSQTTVSFEVAPDAPLGPAAGYLRIRDGGTTLYRGVQRIEVAPELRIESPQVVKDGTGWRAVSQVRNLALFGWNGEARLVLGGKAALTEAVTLPAGASRDVSWPVQATDPTVTVPAEVEFKASNGPSLRREGRLSFFQVQKRPEGGDFWSRLLTVSLVPAPGNTWKQHPDAEIKGESDLSAKVACAYDEDNVYVQVVVRDDVHRQEASPGTTWSQDSLQLAFDMVPGRSENANLVAEGFERTRSEWCLAFTPRGPEIFVHMTPGGSSLSEGSLVHFAGAKLEGGREGTRTVYRATLPWKMLDPKGVRDRERIGLAAAINDSDQDTKFGDRRGIELFGGILRTKNPAEFGTGQLEN